MDNRTLEQKAADTILQRSAKVTIGGTEYEAAPPSIATLILVSEAVARLPKRKLNEKNIVAECLAVAKDCRPLGDIAAILVLGARHITERANDPQTARRGFLRRFFTKRPKPLTKLEALSNEIINTYSPTELHSLIVMLLQRMDLADFFGLTTFLTEVNLLRQTKVETKTTAFGQ